MSRETERERVHPSALFHKHATDLRLRVCIYRKTHSPAVKARSNEDFYKFKFSARGSFFSDEETFSIRTRVYIIYRYLYNLYNLESPESIDLNNFICISGITTSFRIHPVSNTI